MENLPDDKNPNMAFQTIDTSILVALANGTINPLELIHAELASRGVDLDGVWCGFDKAKKIHSEAVASA